VTNEVVLESQLAITPARATSQGRNGHKRRLQQATQVRSQRAVATARQVGIKSHTTD